MPCFQTNPLVQLLPFALVTPPRLGPSKYSDCPCHCVPSSKDHTSQRRHTKQSVRSSAAGAEAGNVPLRSHRCLEHGVLEDSALYPTLHVWIFCATPLASTTSPPLKSVALHRFTLQAVRFSPQTSAISWQLPKFQEVWQGKNTQPHTQMFLVL